MKTAEVHSKTLNTLKIDKIAVGTLTFKNIFDCSIEYTVVSKDQCYITVRVHLVSKFLLVNSLGLRFSRKKILFCFVLFYLGSKNNSLL